MRKLSAKAAELLSTARHVVCSTGAGISKESGIPTFRDPAVGLWENYDPMDLATPEGFSRQPATVWRWYASRREKIREAAPNPGHLALVEIEKRARRFTLITQNIDNLHRRAGSREVIELHGNIERFRCFDRDHPCEEPPQGPEIPPLCPTCGSMIRPDVVWFGEMLPKEAIDRAFAEASRCDLMLVVGTSGMVVPAAALPVEAKRGGAVVIEVNPEPSEITRVSDLFLEGPAGEVLPGIVERMR